MSNDNLEDHIVFRMRGNKNKNTTDVLDTFSCEEQ